MAKSSKGSKTSSQKSRRSSPSESRSELSAESPEVRRHAPRDLTGSVVAGEAGASIVSDVTNAVDDVACGGKCDWTGVGAEVLELQAILNNYVSTDIFPYLKFLWKSSDMALYRPEDPNSLSTKVRSGEVGSLLLYASSYNIANLQ